MKTLSPEHKAEIEYAQNQTREDHARQSAKAEAFNKQVLAHNAQATENKRKHRDKWHGINPDKPFGHLPLPPMSSQSELVHEACKAANVEIYTKSEHSALAELQKKYDFIIGQMQQHTFNAARLRYEAQFLEPKSDQAAIETFAKSPIRDLNQHRAESLEKMRGLKREADSITLEAHKIAVGIFKRISKAAKSAAETLHTQEHAEATRFNLPFTPSPRLIATHQLGWRLRPADENPTSCLACPPRDIVAGIFSLD